MQIAYKEEKSFTQEQMEDGVVMLTVNTNFGKDK